MAFPNLYARDTAALDDMFTTEFTTDQSNEIKFNVLVLNARSIINKLSALQIMLASLPFSPHLIFVSETWLNINNQSLCNIKGYDFISNPRDKKGGGVGIFNSDELDYNRLFHLEISDTTIAETIFAEIILGVNKILIANFYRPPVANKARFITHIDSLAPVVLSNAYSGVIFSGDFNIDLLMSNTDSMDFKGTMNSIELINITASPTQCAWAGRPSNTRGPIRGLH